MYAIALFIAWRRWKGRGAPLVLAAVLALLLGGCIIIQRQVQVAHLDTDRPVAVRSPVRAHLADGSMVQFRSGAQVGREAITGRGERWSVTREPPPVQVTAVPLDSVIGVEAFRETAAPSSVPLSVLATAAGIYLGSALAVAIFGSCPTVYYEEDGQYMLEAEVFSNAFAPLLEARDVHRLTARPDPDGWVRFEVRNEALETHFIDHLELLEVPHAGHERAVPDERSRPLVLSGLRPPARAVDRAGRDLLVWLTGNAVLEADSALLARAGPDDLGDHIDLAIPVSDGADSVALYLRVRNSLLMTVLLYDVMLGPSGARALDWVGRDLEQIGHALALGRWSASRLGMRVSVLEGDTGRADGADGAYRQVARIPDTGPIGWKELAVTVPSPGRDTVHVRLDFVADAWRIDRIAAAQSYRRPAVRVLAAAELRDATGQPVEAALDLIRAADGRYLETTPGQRFTVGFEAGPPPETAERSLLLAAQGYYSEWIRPDWIRNADREAGFEPSDAALYEALTRWREVREPFEARFFGSRIPVRGDEP